MLKICFQYRNTYEFLIINLERFIPQTLDYSCVIFHLFKKRFIYIFYMQRDCLFLFSCFITSVTINHGV